MARGPLHRIGRGWKGWKGGKGWSRGPPGGDVRTNVRLTVRGVPPMLLRSNQPLVSHADDPHLGVGSADFDGISVGVDNQIPIGKPRFWDTGDHPGKASGQNGRHLRGSRGLQGEIGPFWDRFLTFWFFGVLQCRKHAFSIGTMVIP